MLIRTALRSQPQASTIDIVLADDHAILRAGLRRLLEDQPDFRVVGDASSADEAIRMPLRSGRQSRAVAVPERIALAAGVGRQPCDGDVRAAGGAGHVSRAAVQRRLHAVATSGTIVTTAPSVALGAWSGVAGGTVTATIVDAPGTPGDWAGLYDATGVPVAWQYLNGSHALPVSGVGGATLTFVLPAPGMYQVRLFNGIYVLVAVSGSVTAF